jgi:hypothetical protein
MQYNIQTATSQGFRHGPPARRLRYRKFMVTTDSNRNLRIYANLVENMVPMAVVDLTGIAGSTT